MKENLELITSDIYSQYGIEADSVTLSEVLFWHKANYSKYSHFEVLGDFDAKINPYKAIGAFIDYSGEESVNYYWDLTKKYLHEQRQDTIEFLAELVYNS